MEGKPTEKQLEFVKGLFEVMEENYYGASDEAAAILDYLESNTAKTPVDQETVSQKKEELLQEYCIGRMSNEEFWSRLDSLQKPRQSKPELFFNCDCPEGKCKNGSNNVKGCKREEKTECAFYRSSNTGSKCDNCGRDEYSHKALQSETQEPSSHNVIRDSFVEKIKQIISDCNTRMKSAKSVGDISFIDGQVNAYENVKEYFESIVGTQSIKKVNVEELAFQYSLIVSGITDSKEDIEHNSYVVKRNTEASLNAFNWLLSKLKSNEEQTN